MPRWVKKPSSSERSACYLRSACCLRTRNQCTSQPCAGCAIRAPSKRRPYTSQGSTHRLRLARRDCGLGRAPGQCCRAALNDYASNRTGVLLVDPYNDLLSDGGMVSSQGGGAVNLLTHLRALVDAARRVGIVVFYMPHRRWREDDYDGLASSWPLAELDRSRDPLRRRHLGR